MKLRVERDALAEAVAWAARYLPSRQQSPSLAGLKLVADGDALTVSAYDMETSAEITVDAIVDEPGSALVSGRLIADIAKAMPQAEVTLMSEGTQVEMNCGRSQFRLGTLSLAEYPTLPAMPQVSGVISGARFAEAVAQVNVAAMRESYESLDNLSGIKVEATDDSMTLAATDRYRLAVRVSEWHSTTAGFECHALVPARVLSEVSKSLSDASEVAISFSPEGNMIGVAGNGRRITTRLIDKDYPKFRDLLKTQGENSAVMSTAELTEAVKRVSLVIGGKPNMRLHFSDGELELRSGSEDGISNAVEALECHLNGSPIEISFNPAFLLDGLHAIKEPYTELRFQDAQRSVVLTGTSSAQGEEVSEDYRYLLMPIKVR